MKTHTFRPRFELLEGRLTPAGNVTTQLANGSLRLLGDGQDNAIAISQPAPNQFTVTPEDGTTVNGQSGPVTVTGVTRDLAVSLAAGNDRVQFGDFSGNPVVIGRDLTVAGGRGNNSVTSFGPLQVGRDLLILNAAGSGQTDLSAGLTVGDDVTVSNGNGDNSTTIGSFSSSNTVGGDLRISNGFGSAANSVTDTNVGGDIRFESDGADPGAGFISNTFGVGFVTEKVAVGGDVRFDTRSGTVANSLKDTDVGGDVAFTASGPGTATHEIGTFNGNDLRVGGGVTVRSTGGDAQVLIGGVGFQFRPGLEVGRGLRVVTGAGADVVTLTHVGVGRSAEIDTGSGDDQVVIDDSDFKGSFDLRTDRGADTVRIERRLSPQLEGATAFRRSASVDLGRDGDALLLGVAGDPSRRVRFAKSAQLDGGRGTDRLDAANVAGRFRNSGFEESPPPPLLLGPVRYAAGAYVVALETGDFNGDGAADLVTVDQDDNTVSVLLGNGDGTFQNAVAYPVGSTPSGVAVADFNGDGSQDLAVTSNVGNGRVNVLLGNGDGTFQSRVQFSTGTGHAPVAVAAGDFNGDGELDLVTANRTTARTASASLLLGNGDGTFQAPTVTAVGDGDGADVAVGDVNGDGRADAVFATLAGDAVLLGSGDGTFAAPLFTAGPPTTEVVPGDLNGDGRLDLVLGGNSLRVRLGNGDGTFQPAVTVLDEGMSGVAIGDFDRDGAPDIAASHFPDTLGVFVGNGDGTFRQPESFDVVNDGPVVVTDFDGDGFADVAVGNQDANSVSVFRNSRRR